MFTHSFSCFFNPVCGCSLGLLKALEDRWSKYIYATGAIFACCALTYLWSTNVKETNIIDAFEKGCVAGGMEEEDAAAVVERAELHERLLSVLRPTASKSYTVVVGANGTGKSTGIRKAARVSGDNKVNGVVYYCVDTVGSFSKQLCEILNFRPRPFSIEEAVRTKAMSGAGKEGDADPSKEPGASWEILSPALLEAARQFR
jgi:hypothetical protein